MQMLWEGRLIIEEHKQLRRQRAKKMKQNFCRLNGFISKSFYFDFDHDETDNIIWVECDKDKREKWTMNEADTSDCFFELW